MDKTTHEIRLASWKSIAERCQARPREESARQWLAENGIREKQYYYWLRKIRLQACKEMTPELPAATVIHPPGNHFAEISVPDISAADPMPAIVIKTQNATIEVSSSVSGPLLAQLMKAVGHAL